MTLTAKVRLWGVVLVGVLLAVGLAVERPPRDLSPEEASKLLLSELFDQGHIRVVPMFWDQMPKIPPPYYDRRIIVIVPALKGLRATIKVTDGERGTIWSKSCEFRKTRLVPADYRQPLKVKVVDVERLMIESLGPRKYPVMVEIRRGKERMVIRGEATFGPGDSPDPVAIFKLDGFRYAVS